MKPLLLALQFLTRLPVPCDFTASDREWGQSPLYYPLVGAFIGAVLWLLSWLLAAVDLPLQAALLLTAWVALTGGLHLDGLADCADAWCGGFGNPERSLAIMKDPASGPVAVTVLILVLLLKWTALQTLLQHTETTALWLAPVLGRTAILLLMLSAPYLRAQGLGSALIAQLPRRAASAVVMLMTLLTLYVAWPLLLAAVITVVAVRQLAMQRLGGMTGDVYGAAVELTETAVLVAAAL